MNPDVLDPHIAVRGSVKKQSKFYRTQLVAYLRCNADVLAIVIDALDTASVR